MAGLIQCLFLYIYVLLRTEKFPSQTAIYAQGVGLGASKGKEIGKYAEGYSGYVHMAQDAVSGIGPETEIWIWCSRTILNVDVFRHVNAMVFEEWMNPLRKGLHVLFSSIMFLISCFSEYIALLYYVSPLCPGKFCELLGIVHRKNW